MSRPLDIAFIGLGKIGVPAAHHLHGAGHRVRAAEPLAPRRAAIAGPGVPRRATLADAGEDGAPGLAASGLPSAEAVPRAKVPALHARDLTPNVNVTRMREGLGPLRAADAAAAAADSAVVTRAAARRTGLFPTLNPGVLS